MLVGVVVTANVALGGMRAITFVQAFQYWLKLTALAVPVIFLVLQWRGDGQPPVTVPARPRTGCCPTAARLFATYSLILATFLGTMGLPHVLVRFYTNPDGAAARRTTLVVLGLVGMFYLFPTLYGVLGRVYTPQLLLTGRTDAVVLLLPEAALGGGTAGPAARRAGRGRRVRGVPVHLVRAAHQRRRGALDRRARARPRLGARLPAGRARGRASVPLVLALRISGLDVSPVVGLAFAVAASSFCPLLVLGIWWRGLTAPGAAAGILAGGGAAVAAVFWTVVGAPAPGWAGRWWRSRPRGPCRWRSR